MASRPAVFIDRDGTLTEEVGYVNHPARLRLLARSAEAIRRLNQAGVAAVLVTNQAGIARGYFSEDVLRAVNERLVAQLAEAGARLDGLYVCTHHPSEGRPDLARSTMVGDKPTDLVPARAVGAGAVLVLTGYGLGEWEYRRAAFEVEPDHVATDLMDAVDWALARRVVAA